MVLSSNTGGEWPIKLLVDGLTVPEGLRWRDGRLFFSDMYAFSVKAVDKQGAWETVASVPQQPSGLGWLPDGTFVVVSMRDKSLLSFGPEGQRGRVSLDAAVDFAANDMVIGHDGIAYVGTVPRFVPAETLEDGFWDDMLPIEEWPETGLARVDFRGGPPKVSLVANGLGMPNGMVLSSGERELITAETIRGRLTAYTRDAGGALSDRRIWAEVDGHPDGISLDAEGCVWCALGGSFVRIEEGGRVRDRVELEPGRVAFAPCLGGADGHTLFMATAVMSGAGAPKMGCGQISTVEVEIPASA